MRRKVILAIGLVVASLCCVAIAARIVRTRHPQEPTPPFARYDEAVSPSELYAVYAEDEAKGDRLFKGKIIYLTDGNFDKDKVRTDEAGEQYLSVYGITNVVKHSSWGEVARCYLHRPDDPVMEDGTGGRGGVMGYWIKGLGAGRIDGVVVLRKCYLVEVVLEGTDW